MPSVCPCKPPGVILASFMICACTDSGPSGSGGGSDTEDTTPSTSSNPSTSSSDGSSSSAASSGAASSSADSSGTTSSTDSTEGTLPECCSADCSRCQDECSIETVDQATESGAGTGEAVAVFGGEVFWTAGGFAELRRYDALSGQTQQLGTFDYSMTALVANQDAIYFGSSSSSHPVIGSIDPATGASTVLWDYGALDFTVTTGEAQLVLDDTYLYFSVGSSFDRSAGGVFRLPLVGGPPQRVSPPTNYAPGVGVDDDHVFFTDSTNARVSSIAKRDIGTGIAPTELALSFEPWGLFVGDEFIYYGSSTGLDRISKNGDEFSRILEAGPVVSVSGDETHLYATIPTQDRVVRLTRGTTTPQLVELAAEGTRSVAVSCDAVYWVSDGELRRSPK